MICLVIANAKAMICLALLLNMLSIIIIANAKDMICLAYYNKDITC